MPALTPAELRAQIAALQAQLDDVGVYEEPATGRFYVKFRDRAGRSVTRRRTPAGEQLFTREDALEAREQWLAELDAGRVKAGIRRVRFAAYWESYLVSRKGEITPGAWTNLRGDGRRRLLPYFGDWPVSRIDVTAVREWRAEMVEHVENGDLSAKTVNNTRDSLRGCLKQATAEGLIPANPVLEVKPLATEQTEPEYLRTAQIPVYLDACPAHYRDLAEFLLGSGARVSEAVVVRPGDVEGQAVSIMRQRDRGAVLKTRQTKGKRFRTVAVSSRLAGRLAELAAIRREHGREWLFEAPTPRRGRHSSRVVPDPPHRRSVLDWHKATLAEAGLPDMPLHALRHTAAAAWVASGHSLEFVRRQLGHATIAVTSDHYGHMEDQLRAVAADITDELIHGQLPRG